MELVTGNKPSIGWDERDYRLWSDIRVLSSYGLLPNDDRMISRGAVLRLLEQHAERRASQKGDRDE